MNESKSEHRKFIHDFANHLTIIDGGLYKVLANLTDKNQVHTEEFERLSKLSETVKNSIAMLRNYRQYVHSLETNN
jgi:hypothetical protein